MATRPKRSLTTRGAKSTRTNPPYTTMSKDSRSGLYADYTNSKPEETEDQTEARKMAAMDANARRRSKKYY